MPGEFKDYIAFPKPNGYQSLHTTVLTSDAGIVEMQVRTVDMHQRAQFGIASHMSYKQLGKAAAKDVFKKVSFSWVRDLVPTLLQFSRRSSTPAAVVPLKPKRHADAPRWLADLAEAHESIAGSEEFVEGLKEDFFSHRLFVFTPRGDVIDLPVDSTPVDFAYAIHSELGNHMNGSKVNGKMTSFDTRLRNGDVVEILERESAKPTAKWLDYAKTSMARRHIRIALEQTERAGISQYAQAKMPVPGPTPRKKRAAKLKKPKP